LLRCHDGIDYIFEDIDKAIWESFPELNKDKEGEDESRS
jgi:hypothetical protein